MSAREREQRCGCCGLLMSSCGRAIEQAERADRSERRRALLDNRAYFPAVFGGTCAGCHERFPAGDPIRRADGVRYGEAVSYIAGMCCGEVPA